jgi:hypothetical protein
MGTTVLMLGVIATEPWAENGSSEKKAYVQVVARFSADGRVVPVSIIWEDGQEYKIDRVTDIRPAASIKAGGIGMRYTCVVQGRQTYLFREGGISGLWRGNRTRSIHTKVHT